MIKVGQKITFDPWRGHHDTGIGKLKYQAVGTVIAVYPRHTYFTAEYKVGDVPLKMSFKFHDIWGSEPSVKVLKE